jgi:hypothetical protein
VLALGVASIFFPRALGEVVIRPMALIVWLTGLVSENIERAVSQTGSNGSSLGLNQVFDRVFGMIQSLIGAMTSELLRILWGLPLTQIFLGAAVMVLIGQLTSAATQPAVASPGDSGRTTLGEWVRALDPPRRRTYSLWIVLIAGAYLCIAAIVTTPWLIESEAPEGLSAEQLQDRLDGAVLPQEEFDRDFPSVLLPEQDPLVPVEAILRSVREEIDRVAADADPSFPVEPWRSYLNQLQGRIDDRQRGRKDALDRWVRLRTNVLTEQNRLKELALGDFRVETMSPMATPERASYFGSVQGWYRDHVGGLYRRLRDAQAYLRQSDSDLASWASIYTAELEGHLAALRQVGEAAPTPSSFIGVDATPDYLETALFDAPSGTGPRPAPPQPGSGWGPFGLIAGWLLATKSLPLTLIAGMIGFGLLGAAISAFVRRPGNAFEHAVLGDVSGVVIRGISAALVVFLSVKGSLAIFSTGDQEPDPYVLFFACLVGAVFSEDVWLWARGKFLGSFGATTNPGGAPPASNGVQDSANTSEKPASRDHEPPDRG